MATLGWDIGGVNTKVALVVAGRVVDARVRAFELQRSPHRLADVLRTLAAETSGTDAGRDTMRRHAVTMTAELSQMFRAKRAGVAFVLDAVEAAFPGAATYVYTTDGRFVAPGIARAHPLAVAAANWSATARAVAHRHADALLIDTGTTTTDIIPIVRGTVAATGWTDPDRLTSGELVYTGVVRTPAEALASAVPLAGAMCGVSAEGFALTGDVHVWRGDLQPAEYECPTPDGRPASREFAGERLARLVCADREMLDERAITTIADALAEAQSRRIADAIGRVRARHPSLRLAVVTGVGAFLAGRAARTAGLEVIELARELGIRGARHAPAAAVALLLDASPVWIDRISDDIAAVSSARVDTALSQAALVDTELVDTAVVDTARVDTAVVDTAVVDTARVDTVVKVGGGLLAHAGAFEATLKAIADVAREHRLLVVPGGGPFADVVRDVDARIGIDDSAAHWMAVLAMDQYAHLLAARLQGGVLVRTPGDIADALSQGRMPVLAPSQWLQAADPLPHSWDVTSDSIAAWVAQQVGGAQVVLIKPPGARGELVDAYFSRSGPAARNATVVAADSRAAVAGALLSGR